MRNPATRLSFLAATLTLGFAGTALPASPLEDLIEKVRANDRIEVRTERIYTLMPGNPASRGLDQEKHESEHYVRQGRMIYRDTHYEGTSVGGESFQGSKRLAYDGKVLKAIEPGVANISEEAFGAILAPHSLVLPNAPHVDCTLSTYLTDGGPLRRGWVLKNRDIEVHYEGEETVNGLRCSKVPIESISKKEPKPVKSITRLWLAHDRNELPVRAVSYVFNYSKYLPIEEAEVGRFEEVAKGVWFPMAVQFTIYRELQLREGRSIVSNKTELVTKSVVLDPKHPVEFFQDVEIPAGTKVHMLKEGKITRSYTQRKKNVATR